MTFNGFPSELPGDGECDVIIMGVPSDAGSGHISGQRAAPTAIRNVDQWDTMYDPSIGFDLNDLNVVDVGDCYVHNGDIEETNLNITAWVEEYISACNLFITLGGDHSITPHILRGLAPEMNAPIVIHLDAHADIGDHDGYTGGHHGSWVRYALDNGYAYQVHTFGIRALGPQKEWYTKSPRAHQRTHRSGQLAINQIMDICWNAALQQRQVYLSVDMDVVDPAFAPGVVYPEPGGWTSGELINAVQTVCSFNNVIGLDIVEVCPNLDIRETTVRLASRLVIAGLRGYYLSRTQVTPTEVEARRGEMRPVPQLEGAAQVSDDVETKSISPEEVEEKATGQYATPVGDDEEYEGDMATRGTAVVKKSGRGRGKKSAKASKKSSKKSTKASKKSTKATKSTKASKSTKATKSPQKRAAKNATKKTVKKTAAKSSKKAVAPATKKAAKAPAKSSTKAAKKVAKKRT